MAGKSETMVRWAHASGCPRFGTSKLFWAARWSKAEKNNWIAANDSCPLDADDCAARGRLDQLQWARSHGCPWDTKTCMNAALGGHLRVLQWACANGCSWNENTCCDAARHGHMHVLTWERANGCPWDENTCYVAAMNGHVHVLQWARAHGCPWDEDTCLHAVQHGRAPMDAPGMRKGVLAPPPPPSAGMGAGKRPCSTGGHRSLVGADCTDSWCTHV